MYCTCTSSTEDPLARNSRKEELRVWARANTGCEIELTIRRWSSSSKRICVRGIRICAIQRRIKHCTPVCIGSCGNWPPFSLPLSAPCHPVPHSRIGISTPLERTKACYARAGLLRSFRVPSVCLAVSRLSDAAIFGNGRERSFVHFLIRKSQSLSINCTLQYTSDGSCPTITPAN